MLIQITQRSVREILRFSIIFSLSLFCTKFSRLLFIFPSFFARNDSLHLFLFHSALKVFLSLLSIFADYFPHIIISTIFAKYRMITRQGSMIFVIYDYFLFYLIAGWIMLRNGKRESLNSFKSCKSFSLKFLLHLVHIFTLQSFSGYILWL